MTVSTPEGDMLCFDYHSFAHLFLGAFEALLAAQVAAIFEHVPRVRVESPVGAFARAVGRSGHLHKAVIEGERVPNGILPALLILSVEGEEVHNELINLGQGAHLVRGVLDSHGDERDVRVGRLRVRVGATVGLLPGAVQWVESHPVVAHGTDGGHGSVAHHPSRRGHRVHPGPHAAHRPHGADATHAVHPGHDAPHGGSHRSHAAARQMPAKSRWRVRHVLGSTWVSAIRGHGVHGGHGSDAGHIVRSVSAWRRAAARGTRRRVVDGRLGRHHPGQGLRGMPATPRGVYSLHRQPERNPVCLLVAEWRSGGPRIIRLGRCCRFCRRGQPQRLEINKRCAEQPGSMFISSICDWTHIQSPL